MHKSHLLKSLSYAALATAAAREAPSICMLSPVPTLMAGQSITASIENPQGRPCLATLVFSDDNFLPVAFELKPIACLGFQQAQITLPLEAPNGDTTIFWECAGGGAQTCSRVSIINGLADDGALVYEQQGSVECLVPTATLTTLATSISGSITVLNAIPTTLFSNSTAAIVTISSSNTPSSSTISGKTSSSTPVMSPTSSSNTPSSSTISGETSSSTPVMSPTSSSNTPSSSTISGKTSSRTPVMSPTAVEADIVTTTMSISTCSCAKYNSQNPKQV
ncbi:hypothetical protein F5882DRAFT_378045 [Hyaloscypha sp. PMI_1271]|nr:hypothetical protein F5882DRAFT_378045 [Hyaloscypha sp. PMI_1271]